MTYSLIKRNFERGLWNAQMVQVAVKAGVISQEQADEITSGAKTQTSNDTEEIISILEGVN